MNTKIHLTECTSTSDIARDWARDPANPAADGAVVTADFQTAGRGRRGRSWQSGAGENLLMSVVLRPPYPVTDAWHLAFVAALAVSDAVGEFGPAPELKWPNDILIDGRKVSGILVETVVDPSGWAAIVGVGVNVNQAAFDDAAAFDVRPVSLRMATGAEVGVDAVEEAVHRRLMAREAEHRQEGFLAVVAAWRSRMAPGFEIRSGAFHGTQTHLMDNGEIEVRLPDGTFTRWGTVDGEGTFL